MPMNLEYVFTTYGIWLITFILYVFIIRKKLKTYNDALENFKQKQT
ncbi:MAG: hypothetical protein HQM14_06140 [SAR324 cluster bacterium]|nr:hypothetical protein [SAR324 cluster bacterium]